MYLVTFHKHFGCSQRLGLSKAAMHIYIQFLGEHMFSIFIYLFIETGSHYLASWPGISYIDKTGLQLTEIHLPAILCFWDRVSLCSPGWLRIHSLALVGLELMASLLNFANIGITRLSHLTHLYFFSLTVNLGIKFSSHTLSMYLTLKADGSFAFQPKHHLISMSNIHI